MKVFVPIIDSGSGSAVYFKDLRDVLSGRGVELNLVWLAPNLECTPGLAKAILFGRGDMKNYALVHTHADYGTVFKIRGKPLIVTAHHNVFDESYQRYTTYTQKLYHYGLLKRRVAQALAGADRIVAVSHSTKASLEQTFGAAKIDVIYNGVDPSLFRPKQVPAEAGLSGKIQLLFVGNLIKRKGADLLPAIMRKLGGDYMLYYTTGFRPRAPFAEPNMISLGVRSREELVNIYNACDLFLFPSRLEGFGYAVAEAMACGKPVVCTNGSSLPELVLDRRGGFLCEQDNVDDFVEKIRMLSGSQELRRSMGEFNRRRILENFSLRKTAERYSMIYHDSLSRRPG